MHEVEQQHLGVLESERSVDRLGVGARTPRVSMWVTAAIAVQILVSSMASAAVTCSDTIERTRVTRLSHCVVQVIRELVDQHADGEWVYRDGGSEPETDRLIGCSLVDADDQVGMGIGEWVLNLPPPFRG